MINEAVGGLIIPAKGIGGTWIVKLLCREIERLPETEFSMMTLAGLVDINVPPIRLIDIHEIGNLPEGIGQLTG